MGDKLCMETGRERPATEYLNQSRARYYERDKQWNYSMA